MCSIHIPVCRETLSHKIQSSSHLLTILNSNSALCIRSLSHKLNSINIRDIDGGHSSWINGKCNDTTHNKVRNKRVVMVIIILVVNYYCLCPPIIWTWKRWVCKYKRQQWAKTQLLIKCISAILTLLTSKSPSFCLGFCIVWDCRESKNGKNDNNYYYSSFRVLQSWGYFHKLYYCIMSIL